MGQHTDYYETLFARRNNYYARLNALNYIEGRKKCIYIKKVKQKTTL